MLCGHVDKDTHDMMMNDKYKMSAVGNVCSGLLSKDKVD